MQLIIQGSEVFTQHLKQLASLSGAQEITRINDQAFRLRGVSREAEADVAALCLEARLDYAFLPDGRRLGDYKLIAMDMDMTLINIECMDEIADLVGNKREVAAITEAAMRGELDFKQSLRRRLGLFKGIDEALLLEVYERKLQLNPGAERMLQAAQAAGLKTLLATGGFTFFAHRLRDRLKLDYVAANVMEIIDGKLTGEALGEIVDAEAKAAAVRAVAQEHGIAHEDVICMGDGANDLPMLRLAGLGVAYHAKPVVRAQAACAFNFCGLDGLLNLFGE